jgi:hypothetical protein
MVSQRNGLLMLVTKSVPVLVRIDNRKTGPARPWQSDGPPPPTPAVGGGGGRVGIRPRTYRTKFQPTLKAFAYKSAEGLFRRHTDAQARHAQPDATDNTPNPTPHNTPAPTLTEAQEGALTRSRHLSPTDDGQRGFYGPSRAFTGAC